MPHARPRKIIPALLKKLSFFPVLAIQGARQTGKSFLVREILRRELKNMKYLSLDDEALKSAASISARSFLMESPDAQPLIIDEAQKSPPLFDAIKLLVDQRRTPGQYVLLGSTEFSRLALIREALTGRMGRVRLYPLTLDESIGLTNRLKPSRDVQHADLLKYLLHGGLPGICFAREEEHRQLLFQDWVDLTCKRDIHQFKNLKLDGDAAGQILRQCALLEEPTRANIAKSLRLNPKKTATHLEALTELFVLQKLSPHPSGTGKPIYLPFDCGVAQFLGASRLRCLQIWLMNELLVRDQCEHVKKSDFFYYRSSGKKIIHLVERLADQSITAIQFVEHDRLKLPDAELMKAFLAKNPKARGYVCAPIETRVRLQAIPFIPWEAAIEV